jgi:hypothetical protein
MAIEFLRELGIEATDPAKVDMQALFDEHYFRLDLGLFDLRYPRHLLAEGTRLEEFKGIAVALVEMQELWIEWMKPAQPIPKETAAAISDVKKWIASWSTTLPKTALEEAPDRETRVKNNELGQWMQPKEKQLAALATFASYMRSGSVLGLELEDTSGSQILFCPTRHNFRSFASFAGANDKSLAEVLWNESVPTWTEFWISHPREIQVLAMEYAGVEDPDRGVPMSEREKTGLVEHVLQRSAFSLSWKYFGRGIEPVFEAGLAQNLVIGTIGQNNARSGGSGRSNVTSAREVFVPGGLSSGGVLPPQNADSRWRADLGADYFTKVLKAAQSAGAKYTKERAEKAGHFEIVSDTEGEKLDVAAPFLGEPGKTQKPAPRQFTADYLEFFRAYKSGFVNWMRTGAAGKGKESAETWARFLASLAGAKGNEKLEAVVERVYGEPLSSADAEAKSLEWRYLAWLAKQ